ncbi:hypothetical protein HDU76_006045, partial [Blyttiomyces sp. JEL0837]
MDSHNPLDRLGSASITTIEVANHSPSSSTPSSSKHPQSASTSAAVVMDNPISTAPPSADVDVISSGVTAKNESFIVKELRIVYENLTISEFSGSL